MHRVFDSVCRLLAPILAYTTDEAWEHSGRTDSVHVEVFPEVDSTLLSPELETRFSKWLELRSVVAQAVEPARQQKLVGNALEADVEIEVADDALLSSVEGAEAEVEEVLILSQVRVRKGVATVASVKRNPNARCGRCWRHKASVGLSETHPELCERCEEVVVSLA